MSAQVYHDIIEYENREETLGVDAVLIKTAPNVSPAP